MLRYTAHGAFAAIPELEQRIHCPVVLGRTGFLSACSLMFNGKTGQAWIEVLD